jgi:hypothetical protein
MHLSFSLLSFAVVVYAECADAAAPRLLFQYFDSFRRFSLIFRVSRITDACRCLRSAPRPSHIARARYFRLPPHFFDERHHAARTPLRPRPSAATLPSVFDAGAVYATLPHSGIDLMPRHRHRFFFAASASRQKRLFSAAFFRAATPSRQRCRDAAASTT